MAMRFPRGQPVPEDGELNFEIVHRDLKPSNGKTLLIEIFSNWNNHSMNTVFLGQENAEKGFPFYPVTKVGDFGLAVMTSDRDTNNPNAYRGAGSEGYMAPVSANDPVNTDLADLFRRSRSKTKLPRKSETNCPLIPTSGESAQSWSNY